jgi:hypothetical protein
MIVLSLYIFTSNLNKGNVEDIDKNINNRNPTRIEHKKKSQQTNKH